MNQGILLIEQKLKSAGFQPEVANANVLHCKRGGAFLTYLTDYPHPGHHMVRSDLLLPERHVPFAPLVASRVMLETVFPRLMLLPIENPTPTCAARISIEVVCHFDSSLEFAERCGPFANDVLKAWDLFIEYRNGYVA